MDRRQRRSSDQRTALHLFLESMLGRLAARSLRVTTVDGETIAAVGDDAFSDDWCATWALPVSGTALMVSSSGGRVSHDVGRGVRRIVRA